MRSAPVLDDCHFVSAHVPSGDSSVAGLRARLLRAGIAVTATHPDGCLVAPAASLDTLDALGFRVRPLLDRHLLKLAAVTLDLSRPLVAPPTELAVPPDLAASWPHWLIQLRGPLTTEWIDRIRVEGASGLRPVPPYGLWAVVSPERARRLRALPFVAWCQPMQPAYRLHPSLMTATGARTILVRVAPIAALAAVVEALGVASAPRVTGPDRVRATVDAARLPALLRLPAVVGIEAAGADAPLDERSAQIIVGCLDAAPPPHTQPVPGYGAVQRALGLDGTGITIGFIDSGIDTNDDATLHVDLRGRGRAFDDVTGGAFVTDRSGHGTRVASVAVGNAAAGTSDDEGFLYGLGVAPAAAFSSVNAINRGVATDDRDRVARLVRHGATIANLSWCASDETHAHQCNEGYSARSELYDGAVRDALGDGSGVALTLVAAAGNMGPAPRVATDGTLGAPWETKNVIVVGATMAGRVGDSGLSSDLRALGLKSSIGPARDGRMMPTVVAPGVFVTAVHSQAVPTFGLEVFPHRYVLARGTSIAAPHVSGLCALYVQWWRQRTGGVDPSPAMLKALLVNGAVDCAGGPVSSSTDAVIAPVPDRYQGWGRACLSTVVLQSPGSDRGPRLFFDQHIALTATNQVVTLRVSVVHAGKPLRVSLVYTDAPGNPLALQALVNKLSLEVARDDGALTWHGNHFRDGWSVPGAFVDELNNVECVYLPAADGIYTVRVIATRLTHHAASPDDPTPWQDFALVIENAQEVTADPAQVLLALDPSERDEQLRQGARHFIDLLRPGDSVAMASLDADFFVADDRRRAVVVVSGSDARVEPPVGVPVYTCALGPRAAVTLADVAERSGGRLYAASRPDDLAVALGFLRAAVTRDGVIANESLRATPGRVGALVEAAATRAYFTCAWDDPTLQFESASPTSRASIGVRLRHPDGHIVHEHASYVRRVVGRGYVVFDVAAPAPGRWFVEVTTARPGRVRYTVAGFVSSPLMVDAETSSLRVARGARVDLDLRARLDDAAVELLGARATLTRRRAVVTCEVREGAGLRASFVARETGVYTARVHLRGRAAGEPFERWEWVSVAAG